jgi:hypothetical protein
MRVRFLLAKKLRTGREKQKTENDCCEDGFHFEKIILLHFPGDFFEHWALDCKLKRLQNIS